MRNYHLILPFLIAMLLISVKTNGQNNGDKRRFMNPVITRKFLQSLPPTWAETNFKCIRVNNSIVFDSSIANYYGYVFSDMIFQKSVGIDNNFNLFLLNLSSGKLSNFYYTCGQNSSKNVLHIIYDKTTYKIEVDKLNLVKLNHSNDSLFERNNSSKREVVDLCLTFSEYDFGKKSFKRFLGNGKMLHHKSAMLLIPLSIISIKTREAFFAPCPNCAYDSMARTRYASDKVVDNYLLCLTYSKISIANGGSKTSLLANKNSKSNLISENRVKYMRYLKNDKLTNNLFDTLSDERFEQIGLTQQNIVKISGPNSSSLVSVVCNYCGYSSHYFDKTSFSNRALYFVFPYSPTHIGVHYSIGRPFIGRDYHKSRLFLSGDSIIKERYGYFYLEYVPGSNRNNILYKDYFKRKRSKP